MYKRNEAIWRFFVLVPVVVFLAALLVGPLWSIVQGALSGGAASFHTLGRNATLFLVIRSTIAVSVITAIVTTVLGYLIAYAAWQSGPVGRLVVFSFVLLPFWTDVLVKNFAWMELLGFNGVINHALMAMGVITDPLRLLHTRLAVIIGMVHYTLPYGVFPIFAVLLTVDKRLNRAATSLGAGKWQSFWLILLPLTLPGILSASLLTFIIAVGFFVTPVLLGGPKDLMISNTIEYYQNQLVNFNTASLLAIIVTIAIFILVAIYQRIPTSSQY